MTAARLVGLAAIAALALAGCLRDDYSCHTDADCNLGSGGRCEADHRCTVFDSTCPLGHRYTHAGAVDGTCFDDATLPANVCAPGQPPAPSDTHDACVAAVCSALPSCCTTGWSEACVQQAQIACPVTCDTRIAITAGKNLTTPQALYDLRITGTTVRFDRLDTAPGPAARAQFLDWLAPAPGTSEPRLAGLDAGKANLLVGDGATATQLPLPTDRSYDGAYAVDWDRDGRDRAVLACTGVPDGNPLQVLDLATGARRALHTPGQLPMWTPGDWDGDPYPDAVTATGNGTNYELTHSVDSGDAAHVRDVEVAWSSGTGTSSGPPQRGYSWTDVDRDGVLDLVAWGSELRVHFGNDPRPPNAPRTRIDCSPLALNPPADCPTTTNIDLVGTGVAGAGAPLVFSIDDGTRNLYDLAYSGRTPTLPTAPLWSESCMGGCPPIRAVVARDLDGDHKLDLIAIDAMLGIYIRYASGGSMTIPPPAMTAYGIVRVSVSGAPR